MTELEKAIAATKKVVVAYIESDDVQRAKKSMEILHNLKSLKGIETE